MTWGFVLCLFSLAAGASSPQTQGPAVLKCAVPRAGLPSLIPGLAMTRPSWDCSSSSPLLWWLTAGCYLTGL